MAVVLTLVRTKQIRINIRKRNNAKKNPVQTIQNTVNLMRLTDVQKILSINQIDCCVKNTTILYSFWYFITATCFRISLDHLQAIVNI